jgi:hypothetical protein
MSGRRRHPRFVPSQSWDGAVRILRDVMVQAEPDGRLTAFGHAPGVAGEQLALDLAGGGQAVSLRVQVIESRPVILDGGVRHRIQLEILEPPPACDEDDTGRVSAEARG